MENFKYNGKSGWEGVIYAPWWDAPLSVEIEGNSESMSASQIKAVETIKAYNKDLRSTFIGATLAYYQEVEYANYEMFTEDPEKASEEVGLMTTDPTKMWALLETPTIYVPNHSHREKLEFALLFQCRWDPEHNFGAFYSNWEITAIGGQDVVSDAAEATKLV